MRPPAPVPAVPPVPVTPAVPPVPARPPVAAPPPVPVAPPVPPSAARPPVPPSVPPSLTVVVLPPQPNAVVSIPAANSDTKKFEFNLTLDTLNLPGKDFPAGRSVEVRQTLVKNGPGDLSLFFDDLADAGTFVSRCHSGSQLISDHRPKLPTAGRVLPSMICRARSPAVG